MTPTDPTTVNLTPTQDLFLEVLAARYRLGEHLWTFDSRHQRTAKSLAAAGLIQWKHGVTQGTILAWLTDAGRNYALSPTYTPPTHTASQWTTPTTEETLTEFSHQLERWSGLMQRLAEK